MIQCLIRDYPTDKFYHIEDVNESTTLAELKQHFTKFKGIKYFDLKKIKYVRIQTYIY